MTKQIDLDPDAPHTPERTKELADTAAEVMRVLNYATMPNRGGLVYPQQAWELLGNLDTLTLRLPQLLDQIRHFLLTEQMADHLQEGDDGTKGSATISILHASDALSLASGTADKLRRLVQQAQTAIGGVRYAESAR